MRIKEQKLDLIYHMVRCKDLENPQDVKIHFIEHKGFTWVTPQDALTMHLMPDEDACIALVYGLNTEGTSLVSGEGEKW